MIVDLAKNGIAAVLIALALQGCATGLSLAPARLEPVPFAGRDFRVHVLAVAPVVWQGDGDVLADESRVVIDARIEGAPDHPSHLSIESWRLVVRGHGGKEVLATPSSWAEGAMPDSLIEEAGFSPHPALSVQPRESKIVWVAFAGLGGISTAAVAAVSLRVSSGTTPAVVDDIPLSVPGGSGPRWRSPQGSRRAELSGGGGSFNGPVAAIDLPAGGANVLWNRGKWVHGLGWGLFEMFENRVGESNGFGVGLKLGPRLGWLPFRDTFGVMGGVDGQFGWTERKADDGRQISQGLVTAAPWLAIRIPLSTRVSSLREPFPVEQPPSPLNRLSLEAGVSYWLGWGPGSGKAGFFLRLFAGS